MRGSSRPGAGSPQALVSSRGRRLAVLLGLLTLVGAPLSFCAGAPPADKAPAVAAGQALRTALDARKAGDTDRAAELLAAVAEQHPVIADYADLLRSTVFLEAGRYAAAL